MNNPQTYLTLTETAATVHMVTRSVKLALYEGRFLTPDIFLGENMGWEPQRLTDWAIWSKRINAQGESLLTAGPGRKVGVRQHDPGRWDVKTRHFHTLRQVSILTNTDLHKLTRMVWDGRAPGHEIVLGKQRGWSEKAVRSIANMQAVA